MNGKPRRENQNTLEDCPSGERSEERGKHAQASRPKPPWPAGLRLPRIKDVTCFILEDLAVILSRQAFEQLFAYTYSATSEICCLGTVKQEGERFRVERFHLIPQSGSAGHTELDQEALASLVEELIGQGRAEEARSLKCWAHSHPGIGVFWSRTDEETCKRLVSDYLISLVVSDDFALRCRIDVGGAVPFAIDHVPVLVEMPVQADSLQKYAEEVEEKVKHTPLLLSESTGKTEEREKALVSEYCDTCGSFHVEGRCPLTDHACDEQAWDEYVRQCDASGLEPSVEEFEFYGLDDPEFWS